MQNYNAVDEDWNLLKSFFPANWKSLANETGALKGLRQDKSEENYLRVLLLHFGCGFSMRETVARAKQGNLAKLSDVALLKRLRKSKEWLYCLCRALFEERGIKSNISSILPFRLIDGTVVKEPGKTGSQWRVHYSFQWPTLACDYFKITATEGEGTAESLQQYPICAGDYVVADRGYCHARGIHFVVNRKAYVSVRFNPHGMCLQTETGASFPLLRKLQPLEKTGQIHTWKVLIPLEGHSPVTARLCVVRKSQAAITLAHKKAKLKATSRGSELQPETLIYAKYVMILTTFPEKDFSCAQILQGYRFRWQIELVFKRFKQIAQLGHLPKHHDDSVKAWLYGKLFVALLTEKIIQHAYAVSPWGYEI